MSANEKGKNDANRRLDKTRASSGTPIMTLEAIIDISSLESGSSTFTAEQLIALEKLIHLPKKERQEVLCMAIIFAAVEEDDDCPARSSSR